MRLINRFTLGLLTAGCVVVAGNATVSAAPLHEACSADIRHYCDTVTPGNGRLMACLYAHEDKVTEECDSATDDVGDILDTVFATINDVMSECQPDIEKHCSGVDFGEGRIISCLNANSASLADACKAVVPHVAEDLAN